METSRPAFDAFLEVVDELTNTRGKSRREAISQGIANLVCGLMGGTGGCVLPGQTLININNGASKYLSSFTAAVFLFIFIIFLKDLIFAMPSAIIVGVMLVVVYLCLLYLFGVVVYEYIKGTTFIKRRYRVNAIRDTNW